MHSIWVKSKERIKISLNRNAQWSNHIYGSHYYKAKFLKKSLKNINLKK
jgi:hypothetical protein